MTSAARFKRKLKHQLRDNARLINFINKKHQGALHLKDKEIQLSNDEIERLNQILECRNNES